MTDQLFYFVGKDEPEGMAGPNSAPNPVVNKSTYEAVVLDDPELEVKSVTEGFGPVTARSEG